MLRAGNPLAQRQRFEGTPKAFANFSPGFERRENSGGLTQKPIETLRGFANHLTLSGLRMYLNLYPELSLRSNPGLKLAHAFGVISN